MKNVFKFRVKKEKSGFYFMVELTAPTIVTLIHVDSWADFETQEKIAKAETKMALIKAIMDSAWEFE